MGDAESIEILCGVELVTGSQVVFMYCSRADFPCFLVGLRSLVLDLEIFAKVYADHS